MYLRAKCFWVIRLSLYQLLSSEPSLNWSQHKRVLYILITNTVYDSVIRKLRNDLTSKFIQTKILTTWCVAFLHSCVDNQVQTAFTWLTVWRWITTNSPCRVASEYLRSYAAMHSPWWNYSEATLQQLHPHLVPMLVPVTKKCIRILMCMTTAEESAQLIAYTTTCLLHRVLWNSSSAISPLNWNLYSRPWDLTKASVEFA